MIQRIPDKIVTRYNGQRGSMWSHLSFSVPARRDFARSQRVTAGGVTESQIHCFASHCRSMVEVEPHKIVSPISSKKI